MILLPSRKAVIFKLRDPGRILNFIPTAKKFTLKGQELVAVPHKPEEVTVLRNLGFDVPSPIRYHYDWPASRGLVPFNAQKEAAAFMSSYRRSFNLSELGTGKSLASLWAFDYLRAAGVLHRVLVVAPLSTLERTWADEVFTHFPHLSYSVLHGSADKRKKLLAQEADVYIVNHDGVEIIAPALKGRADIDLILVDEVSQVARNASTDRWKALNLVVNKQVPRMCWGMTGTPTPNGPADAWAQCRLLVPENVPPYFNRFKDTVMRQVSTYNWVPRDNATELVQAAMQPAVRFTRAECVDLPPLTYESRQVDLTPEQNRAYKEMMATLKAEAAGGQILAVNEAVKLSKLVQICCGVAYNTQGEEVLIPSHTRINAVKEIVESAAGKVVVFVPFVSALRHLADALRKHFTVEIIHGGVSKGERDRILAEFQRSPVGTTSFPFDPARQKAFNEENERRHALYNPGLRVLVAQPATLSHGVTLTAANTIVWYAPVTSNDIAQQAEGRVTRPGQKLNTFIIELEGTALERKLYGRLRNKQKLQGLLLDEVEADRGEFIA